MRIWKKQYYLATRDKHLAKKKAERAAAKQPAKNKAECNPHSRAKYSANSEIKKCAA